MRLVRVGGDDGSPSWDSSNVNGKWLLGHLQLTVAELFKDGTPSDAQSLPG